MPIGILWRDIYNFKCRLPRIIEDSRNKVIWSSHQNDGHSICLLSCYYHSLSIPRTKSHIYHPYTILALSSLTVTPRCSLFHLPIHVYARLLCVCIKHTMVLQASNRHRLYGLQSMVCKLMSGFSSGWFPLAAIFPQAEYPLDLEFFLRILEVGKL